MLAVVSPRLRKQTVCPSNEVFRMARKNIFVLQYRSLANLSDSQQEFQSKYAHKLRERVKREGLSDLNELKAKLAASPSLPREEKPKTTLKQTAHIPVEKDSTPVKPLADIMDLRKIFVSQHSAEQISQVWNTYHITKSKDKGRGYLSATIPQAVYTKMAVQTAVRYPSFILPLARTSSENVEEKAYEFFYLQWDFHNVPQHPLRDASKSSLQSEVKVSPLPSTGKANPVCSTVLFTPLQEYKLRQSFAQPYLVLTFYTDLVTTHDIVLMRGELTPSPSSPERFLLSQLDAQLLIGSLQRFYLADEDQGSVERAQLLKSFHEKASEFQWGDLLGYADPTV